MPTRTTPDPALGSTPDLLAALGNPQRFSLLAEITTRGETSHRELLEVLPLSKAAVSKRLGELEALHLVRRPDNNRGAWKLEQPTETAAFILSAAALSARVGEARTAVDRGIAERMAAQLGGRGGSS